MRFVSKTGTPPYPIQPNPRPIHLNSHLSRPHPIPSHPYPYPILSCPILLTPPGPLFLVSNDLIRGVSAGRGKETWYILE